MAPRTFLAFLFDLVGSAAFLFLPMVLGECVCCGFCSAPPVGMSDGCACSAVSDGRGVPGATAARDRSIRRIHPDGGMNATAA